VVKLAVDLQAVHVHLTQHSTAATAGLHTVIGYSTSSAAQQVGSALCSDGYNHVTRHWSSCPATQAQAWQATKGMQASRAVSLRSAPAHLLLAVLCCPQACTDATHRSCGYGWVTPLGITPVGCASVRDSPSSSNIRAFNSLLHAWSQLHDVSRAHIASHARCFLYSTPIALLTTHHTCLRHQSGRNLCYWHPTFGTLRPPLTPVTPAQHSNNTRCLPTCRTQQRRQQLQQQHQPSSRLHSSVRQHPQLSCPRQQTVTMACSLPSAGAGLLAARTGCASRTGIPWCPKSSWRLRERCVVCLGSRSRCVRNQMELNAPGVACMQVYCERVSYSRIECRHVTMQCQMMLSSCLT
jgi:hypothetical protein